MATREGSIRVTLASGAFQSGLRRMQRQVATAGKKMGASLRGPMSAGLAAAKTSLAGFGSSLKNTIGTAAKLGGAMATGFLIKDAIQLSTLYRNIAMNLDKFPGKAMSWQKVQEMVSKSADRTGQNTEGVAKAFDDIVQATGDVALAKDVLDDIGTMATATGHDIEVFGNLAQMAARKFGIVGDEMPEVLANIESMTGVGGPKIDALGNRFGILAGEAESAGFVGAEGMKSLFNMLVLVDSKIGEKAEPALTRMFEILRTGGTELEDLQKKMKFKFDVNATAVDKIKKLLTSDVGRAELMKKLTGTSRTAFLDITKSFEDAMDEAQKVGKPEAEAVAIALKAFEDNLAGADKKLRSFEEMTKKAADRAKDDPAIALRKALNKVRDAFAQPKMIKAITSLAKKLPELAEGVASLVDFMIEKPWTAGIAAVGLRAGLPGVGGAVRGMIGGGGAAAGAAGAGGAGAAGAGVAGAAAGGGLAQTTLGAASALQVLKTVAIGAAVGVAAGTLIYENAVAPALKKEAESREANLEASQLAAIKAREMQRKGTVDQKRAALASLQEQISEAKGRATEIIMSDAQRMGEIVSIFTDLQTPLEKHKQGLNQLEAEEKRLAAAIGRQQKMQDKVTANMDEFGKTFGKLTTGRKIDAPFGPGGKPRNKPGHESPGGDGPE